jgi:hypothetical protein
MSLNDVHKQLQHLNALCMHLAQQVHRISQVLNVDVLPMPLPIADPEPPAVAAPQTMPDHQAVDRSYGSSQDDVSVSGPAQVGGSQSCGLEEIQPESVEPVVENSSDRVQEQASTDNLHSEETSNGGSPTHERRRLRKSSRLQKRQSSSRELVKIEEGAVSPRPSRESKAKANQQLSQNSQNSRNSQKSPKRKRTHPDSKKQDKKPSENKRARISQRDEPEHLDEEIAVPNLSSQEEVEVGTPTVVTDEEKIDMDNFEGLMRFGEEVVGQRVQVWWGGDKKWFDGRVLKYDGEKGVHQISYDDGTSEPMNLSAEQVRFPSMELGHFHVV